jgi:hypothetical protein
VKGWRHAALGEWSEVEALDPLLADAGPRDLARLEALRLRVRWRLESPDAAVRGEGAALAGELLQSSGRLPDLILSARALAAADRPDHALLLIDQVSRGPRRADGQRAAIALLEELRPQVDAEEWQAIRRRFSRRRS